MTRTWSKWCWYWTGWPSRHSLTAVTALLMTAWSCSGVVSSMENFKLVQPAVQTKDYLPPSVQQVLKETISHRVPLQGGSNISPVKLTTNLTQKSRPIDQDPGTIYL